MKILSIKYPKGPEDEKKLEEMTNYYRMAVERKINAENNLLRIEPPDQDSADIKLYKADTSKQLEILFSRSWIMAKREPRLSRAKILQTIIVALFMIPVFWQLNDYTSETSNYSMVGAIYFTTVLQMFLNFLPTVIVFQAEKPVYVRERASNMYDIWVYATTKLLAELPIMLGVPLLLNFLLYFAVGYQDKTTEFLAFYLALAMMVQAATAMGYFLSSIFNHETTAVAFSPIINLPLNLLGGYMINLNGIF